MNQITAASITRTIWAVASLFLVLVLLVVNYFRFELLGIEPGNAGHNFGFGLFILLPVLLLTFTTSTWVLIWTMAKWKLLSTGQRFATGLHSSAVIVHGVFLGIRLVL